MTAARAAAPRKNENRPPGRGGKDAPPGLHVETAAKPIEIRNARENPAASRVVTGSTETAG